MMLDPDQEFGVRIMILDPQQEFVFSRVHKQTSNSYYSWSNIRCWSSNLIVGTTSNNHQIYIMVNPHQILNSDLDCGAKIRFLLKNIILNPALYSKFKILILEVPLLDDNLRMWFSIHNYNLDSVEFIITEWSIKINCEAKK